MDYRHTVYCIENRNWEDVKQDLEGGEATQTPLHIWEKGTTHRSKE